VNTNTKKGTVEVEVDFDAVRRAVRLRLGHLGFTIAAAARELGVSKQATSRRLSETVDLDWLAAVAGVPRDVLATGNAAAIIAQPPPAEGWLRSIR
jgi:hypothetical protein